MIALRWIAGPLLTAACCAVALACLWDAVQQAPLRGPWFQWNDIRAARCVATGWGVDLYAGADEPAMDGHIYGPVGFWLCSAAGLARTPVAAIQITVVMSALFLLAPLGLLLGRRRDQESRETELALRAALIVCLASYWMIYPGAAWNPHVDAQAIGLMALACWAAFRLAEDPKRRSWLALAALAAGAAVWTKQTAAPVLGFAPALLWLGGHRRVALHAGLATFASCVFWGLASGAFYGLSDVLLAMFAFPSQHARYPSELLYEHGRAEELWAPAVLAVVATALWKAGARPPNRAIALAVFTLALTPFAVAGRIKLQGFSNNFLAPMVFLAFAAAVAAVETARAPELPESWKRWARTVTTCVLVLMTAQAASHVLVRRFARSAEREQPLSETALRFAADHPGQAYFPTRPLATLFADRRWYATAQAWRTRGDAGFDVELALPPDLRYVVLERPSPEFMQRFPGFELRDVPELAGWSVYVRSGMEPQ